MKKCKNCSNMDIYEKPDDPAKRLMICSETVDEDIDGAMWMLDVTNFDGADCLDFNRRPTECAICLERHPGHKSFCPFNNEHHMLKKA